MRIGILCEDNNQRDGEIIKVLLIKYFQQKNISINIDDFKIESCGGHVYHKLGVLRAWKLDKDFVVITTDSDGNNVRLIMEKLRKEIDKLDLEKFTERIAIICPEPHIEALLFRDESSIKNVFGLNHTRPIPYPRMRNNPKLRFSKIFEGYKDITMTENEMAVRVCESINIELLQSNDSSYSNLVNQLDRIRAIE